MGLARLLSTAWDRPAGVCGVGACDGAQIAGRSGDRRHRTAPRQNPRPSRARLGGTARHGAGRHVVPVGLDAAMNRFWSQIARELSPYVPGEQPRIANLVKLNTNESPFGPSPRALEAMRAAAADTLRLYPDPEATELREALAAHHVVEPEQVYVGNGAEGVLADAVGVLFNQATPWW